VVNPGAHDLGEPRRGGGPCGPAEESHLGVQVREVSLDGPHADGKRGGDVRVASSGRDEPQHLRLPFRGNDCRACRRRRNGGSGGAAGGPGRLEDEGVEGFEKSRPRRLIREQEMIATFQRHELRSRDQGGELPTSLELDHRVIASVEDERGGGDPAGKPRDVDPAPGSHEP
jgi:hypothetical protein